MTNQEIQELASKSAKGTGIPMSVFEKMTPKEHSLFRFYQSRETNWAEQYGGVVPYYPSQRHIEKNLAPEQNMAHMALDALANANQIARKNGLMSPQLADKMLPTMLVEGGIGINNWGYPDTPKYRDILTKAGLPPTRAELIDLPSKGTTYDRDVIGAKMMHALMAAKAAQYGDDLAIERWNGKGTNARLGADASNHYRKVLETEALLKHPKNKELAQTWSALSQRYAGEDPQEMRAPRAEIAEESDVPEFIGNAVKAVRSALPDKPIERLQQAVRNFTAPTMVPKEEAKKKGGAVKMPDNYSQGGWKII